MIWIVHLGLLQCILCIDYYALSSRKRLSHMNHCGKQAVKYSFMTWTTRKINDISLLCVVWDNKSSVWYDMVSGKRKASCHLSCHLCKNIIILALAKFTTSCLDRYVDWRLIDRANRTKRVRYHKQTKVFLLSLHLPAIHVEALSHSTNKTPECISVCFSAWVFNNRSPVFAFAQKNGMRGERTSMDSEPLQQQAIGGTQRLSNSSCLSHWKMCFTQRPSVLVIASACHPRSHKYPYTKWGHTIMPWNRLEREKVRRKAEIILKQFRTSKKIQAALYFIYVHVFHLMSFALNCSSSASWHTDKSRQVSADQYMIYCTAR